MIEEWNRRIAIAVSILMGCLLLLKGITMLVSWRADALILVSSSSSSPPVISSSTKWINQIPDWHLFGKYDALSQTASLPVTGLQLRLLGVIKKNPEKYSRVIISEGDEPGKVYQMGDTLSSSGIRIQNITQEGVVLDNGGTLEKLPLERPELVFEGMPKPLLKEVENG